MERWARPILPEALRDAAVIQVVSGVINGEPMVDKTLPIGQGGAK